MKFLASFISPILAGIVFSFCGIVQLQSDGSDALAIAALSTVGLFIVLTFNLSLFTSKVGYLLTEQKNLEKNLEEIPVVLAGNLIGTILVGIVLGFAYSEQMNSAVSAYLSVPPLQLLANSVFGGMLIFIASHIYYRTSGSATGCIIAFLVATAASYCGFDYFITDMFFIAGAFKFTERALLRYLFVLAGNCLGAVLFSEMYYTKKLLVKDNHKHHHKHHSSHHHSHHAKRDIDTEKDSSAEATEE